VRDGVQLEDLAGRALAKVLLLLQAELLHEQVVDADVGHELVHGGGHRDELGVVLAHALARDGAQRQLLALAHLDDGDGLGVVAVAHRPDHGVLRVQLQVVAGDWHGLVAGALDAEVEGDLRELGAVVLEGPQHLARHLGLERDQAQAVRDELVVEHRCVHLDLHQVDGDGGHVGDDHAPQRVRHAGLRLAEHELAVVVLAHPDLDVRPPGQRLAP
jgi:hypothetical protein